MTEEQQQPQMPSQEPQRVIDPTDPLGAVETVDILTKKMNAPRDVMEQFSTAMKTLYQTANKLKALQSGKAAKKTSKRKTATKKKSPAKK